jgi:ectoine hydroxylase-related dioxygenase (phytanoyl-CoA dioxygenase family)
VHDLLGQIRRDGYARTTADVLLGADVYARLLAAVDDLRAQGLPPDKPLNPASAGKTYLKRWLGSSPVFDPASAWGQIAMETPIYALAKQYLGSPIIQHYNIWQTLPTSNPPTASQLWHRDIEDRVMLKAFLYLTDVDSGCGPLWYLPGTHATGKRHDLAPAFSLVNNIIRTSDKQMAAKVPASEWVELTGPAGTLLLVDTAGYHKGGYATQRERWLYTCQFATAKCRPRAGRPFLK